MVVQCGYLDAVLPECLRHSVDLAPDQHEIPGDRGLPVPRGLEVERRIDAHGREEFYPVLGDLLGPRHADLQHAVVHPPGTPQRPFDLLWVEFGAARRGTTGRGAAAGGLDLPRFAARLFDWFPVRFGPLLSLGNACGWTRYRDSERRDRGEAGYEKQMFQVLHVHGADLHASVGRLISRLGAPPNRLSRVLLVEPRDVLPANVVHERITVLRRGGAVVDVVRVLVHAQGEGRHGAAEAGGVIGGPLAHEPPTAGQVREQDQP